MLEPATRIIVAQQVWWLVCRRKSIKAGACDNLSTTDLVIGLLHWEKGPPCMPHSYIALWTLVMFFCTVLKDFPNEKTTRRKKKGKNSQSWYSHCIAFRKCCISPTSSRQSFIYSKLDGTLKKYRSILGFVWIRITVNIMCTEVV